MLFNLDNLKPGGVDQEIAKLLKSFEQRSPDTKNSWRQKQEGAMKALKLTAYVLFLMFGSTLLMPKPAQAEEVWALAEILLIGQTENLPIGHFRLRNLEDQSIIEENKGLFFARNKARELLSIAVIATTLKKDVVIRFNNETSVIDLIYYVNVDE